MLSKPSSTASCRCRLMSLRSVEAATTSCARLSGRCLKMRVRRSGVRVQAFVSCRLDYCNSLFFGIYERLMNRLQSVQNAAARLLASDAPTTYRRCSVSYTGYRYASASTSRWSHSYTSRCLAFHHRTWPTTAVLSPMLVSGDCVLQRAEHA